MAAVSAATAALAAFLDGFGGSWISCVAGTVTPQMSAASSTDSGSTFCVASAGTAFFAPRAGFLTGIGSIGSSSGSAGVSSTGMSMIFFFATGLSGAARRARRCGSGCGCAAGSSSSSKSGWSPSSGMYCAARCARHWVTTLPTVRSMLPSTQTTNAAIVSGSAAYTLMPALSR